MSNRKKNIFLSLLMGLLIAATSTILITKAKDDPFGDWFAELLKELEEEEKKETQPSINQGREEKDVTVIKPRDIPQDESELFLNPPMQSVSDKDDEKKETPIKEARKAAQARITDLVGRLNELEKKIEDIMASSFTPEFKDTFQSFYSGPISLISITADSIEYDQDYLNLFLTKPFQDKRKTIISLIKELDELLPHISLTATLKEEDKTKTLEEMSRKPEEKRTREKIAISHKQRGSKK